MVFFVGFLKIIAPGVGFKQDFSAPGVGVSHFRCGQGLGNLPFQKIPRGFKNLKPLPGHPNKALGPVCRFRTLSPLASISTATHDVLGASC